VGISAQAGHGATLVRLVSRWMLPTAGAAAIVLAGASQAHAAGIQVTPTTPAGTTTNGPLTWDVTSTDPTATSCQLYVDTGTGPVPVGALEACPFTASTTDPLEVSYAVPNAQPGIYTLTAYDAAVASVDPATTPSATSPTGTDIHPLAPSLQGPAGPSNDRSPSWTVSGVVSGASLDCTATGSVSGTLPASCTAVDPATGQATASVDLSAATSDETVTLSVTQTANPGTTAAEASTAATADYALDITPPKTLTPSPGSSSGSNPKPTFSLTGGPIDATDTLSCTVSGGAGTCSATATTVTLDLGGLADGPYTFTVKVTDAAGNTASASGTYTLLPPRPVVTPAAASGNTNTVSVTITEPATDVTLTCTITGPSTTATLTPCAAGANTLDLSAAKDGTYTITVTATDSLGLTSSGTATYYVDRAVTTPTVGLPSAPAASGSGHTVAVTVSEPDTDGVTLSCSVSGPGTATLSSCGASMTLDIAAGAPDGAYVVSVTATDALGNTSTGTATYTLVPPAPTTATPDKSSSTGSASWTMIDTVPGVTYTCSVTGGPSGASVSCASGSTVTLTLPVGAADGTYTVTVRAVDGNGNAGDPTTLTYTLVPPAPTTPAPTRTASDPNPTWDLSDTVAGVTYQCTAATGPATVVPTCGPTVLLNLTGKPLGTYTLVVRAVDSLGHAGDPLTLTYTLVATAPTTATPTMSGSSKTPSWTLSDAFTVTYQCTVISGPATFTPTCGSTVSLNLTGDPDGVYVVRVVPIDSNGNAGDPLTLRYTLVPPAPTLTSGTVSTASSGRHPSWGLTDAVSGVSYTCSVSGPATLSAACGGPSVSLDLTGLPEGVYTITVRAVDSLGNAGDSLTLTYRLLAPAPTTTDPVAVTGSGTTATWTVTDTSTVTGWQCSVTGPSGSSPSVTCTGGVVHLSLGAAAPDGTYTVTVQALDSTGTAGDPLTLTDTLVPPAPTTPTPDGRGSSHTATWAMTDSVSPVTYTCSLVSGATTTGVTVTCTTATVKLSLPAGAADGVYTVTVRAVDSLGHAGDPTTLTYTLVPPAPTSTSGPAVTSGSGTAPSWSLTDAVGGVTYQCSAVSGPAVVTASCGPTVSLALAGAPDGTYSLTVVAVDSLGNAGDPLTLSYTLVPPAPALTSGSAVTTSSGRTPSWTVTDVISGVTYRCTAVSGPAAFTPTCGSTVALNLTSLADGTYVFTVQAVDSLGHAGDPLTITYTVIPPAPTTAAVHHTSSTGTTSWTVADAQPVASWLCSVTGPSAATVTCTGSTVVLTLSAGAADGDYSVVLRAVDSAGNAGDPVTLTYTLVPPAPTTTSGPATSSGSGHNPSWTLTDTVAGVTYQCSAPTGPAAVPVSCGPTVSFDLNGAPDGTYSVTVVAVDSLGNSGDPLTLSYTLVPPPSSTATPDQRGSSHTATWTVSNPVPGVTYTCSVTGPTTTGVTVTCTGGTVTLTLPAGAADGVYSVSVTAVDSNGNPGAPTTLTYTLIPPAPTSSPAAVRSNASRTPSWTLTDAVSGVTYVCTVVSGPATFTPTCGATVSLNLTGDPDGVYVLTVQAVDALGNAGDPLTVSYTMLPPAPTVVSSPTSPASSHTPSWTVTDLVPGVTYTCTVSPSTNATVTCAGGDVQLTLGSSAADGTYTISVFATDDLGNTGPARTLTYILIPPAPTVTSAPPASASSRTATWTVTDAVPGVTYLCTVSGASTVGASVTCTGGVVTLTLGSTAVDGTYDVTVQAVDSLGRAGDSLVVHYTLIPPAPTTSQPTRSASSTSPSWTLSDSVPGVTYQCTVVDGPASFTPSCGSTVSLSLAGDPDGTYVVSVVAVDSLGNAGDPLTLTYTLIPPAPTTAGPSRAASAPTVTWIVSDTVPGVTYLCGPVSGPGTGVVTCGSTVTLDVSGQPDGVYSFTIRAVDALGNAGDPLTLTYTLVPTAPTTATPDKTASSLTPSWPVSDAVPGVTYVCTAVSGPASFTPSCGPTVSLNLTGLPDGTYTLTVQAVDSVGSTGDPLTLTYTLIPPAPTTAQPTRTLSGLDPRWVLSDRVAGVTYLCTVVSGPAAFTPTCGPTVSLDLTGLPDGVYVLTVQAVDSLGHVGDPLTLTYTLIPPAPTTATPTVSASSPAPSWPVSDSVPGVTWLCTVVSGPVAFTPTCGSTVSLDLTGDPDGVYVLTVQAVDSLGNAGDPLTLTYTLIPPAPTTPSPAKSAANRTPSWTLTDAVPGATYTCTVVSGPVAFTPTCGSTVSLDLTGDPDGVYVLTVQAVDSLGHAGDPLTLTYTLIPPAPKLTGAIPASPGNNRSPQWTVTDAVAGTTYLCSVTGPTGSSATVTCATGTVVLALANQPEGLYTISVLAVDALGNSSDPNRPLTFTYLLDTLAPSAPAVAVTPSPSQGVKVTYTISGVEPGGVLTCTLSAPSGSTLTVPAACGTTVALDLTGQPNGSYVLSVTVTDAAGNTSTATTAAYVYDTKPPAAPVVTVPAATSNNLTPTLTITTEPGATITCTVSRNLLPVAGLGCAPDGTVDLTGLADGEFEITVVATDQAGNVGPGTTVTYLLDTVAPDAPVVTAPASPSPIVSPTWLWTGEDGSVATCMLTGPPGVVFGPTTCASPFTFSFSGLPDGAYTFTVFLTDAAGNVSKSVSTTFLLDRTAPVPPTVIPPDSPSSNRDPAWTISGPRGATLTCTLLRGGTVVYAAAACPAGGVFSLAGMPDGTYTLRVTATDRAGNVSAASVSTYVLDTRAPAAPTLDFASGSPSSSRTPDIGFTLPAGTTGHCELRLGSTLIASKPCRDAVSFTLPNSDGTYTLLVYAVDAAGNLSKPLVVSYVLVGHGSGGVTGSGGTSSTGGGHSGTPAPPAGPKPVPVPPLSVARQLADHLGGPVNVVKKVVSSLTNPSVAGLPLVNDKLTKDVSSAVRSVVNAVSKAGGGTGFPLLLLVIVTGFLIAQSRIDRRDPKLALASVAADDTLQFRPPPSRGDRR
jgi:large repetitive protein